MKRPWRFVHATRSNSPGDKFHGRKSFSFLTPVVGLVSLDVARFRVALFARYDLGSMCHNGAGRDVHAATRSRVFSAREDFSDCSSGSENGTALKTKHPA